MKNQKGIVVATVLYIIIAAMALLFIPNPISSSVGVGIRPNKTVQTEKVELITDKAGNPVAYKTTTSDQDIQQHVTFWEWLKSLPILVLILMGLGLAFPVVGVWFNSIWSKAVAEYNELTGETKKIVVSIKAGLATIQDPVVKQNFLDALSKQQDSSTKDLVKELLKN